MTTRGVRVREAAVFWRAAAVVFVVRQFLLLGAVLREVPPPFRLVTFVAGRWGTRRSVYFALLGGAVAAFLADVLVRLVVAPAVRAWLSPRGDGSEGLFHLTPGERVIEAAPARRRVGRSWQPGSLVVTDLRTWFFPTAWDGAPWSVRHDEPVSARLVPAPLASWGVFRDVPDLLAVLRDGEVAQVFALADPPTALDWFLNPAGAGFVADARA